MDIFDMIDRNHNGRITREEFNNAYDMLVARQQMAASGGNISGNGASFPGGTTSVANGGFGCQGTANPQGGFYTTGTTINQVTPNNGMFDMIDRNQDGVISSEEITKAYEPGGTLHSLATLPTQGGVAHDSACGQAPTASVAGANFDHPGLIPYSAACAAPRTVTVPYDASTFALPAINGKVDASVTVEGSENLFLDDSRNWQAITDIVKALVIVESDEKIFLEEIRKLPGGDEALQWLQGGTWEARVDPKTGKTYYVNPKTGETSWTKPAGVADLPPGWESRVDPVTGKTYYVNPSTGETSSLVPGWEAKVDPQTGRTYYVNPRTGETSWTPPVGGVDAALAKVKGSIEQAKMEAHKEAVQARQDAATARVEAKQAKDMADTFQESAKHDEDEHEALLQSKEKAHEEEKKAEAEAKRLADMAKAAADAAAEAQRQADLAKAEAANHHNFASDMQRKVEANKQKIEQIAAAAPSKKAAAGQVAVESKMKTMAAQKAQSRAHKSQQKVQDALARVQKLEAASKQSDAPSPAMIETKSKVEEAANHKVLALQAKKRMEGLRQLMIVISNELAKAEAEWKQSEEVYAQKQHMAQIAVEQTKAEQAAAGLGLGGEAILTPQDMAQALQEAKMEAARAQVEAHEDEKIASEKGQEAQAFEAAREEEESMLQESNAHHESHEELEADWEAAALKAAQAKANAEGLAAAAAAAARQSQSAHSKAQAADAKYNAQVKHSQEVAQKEHAAFQKRFGEGKLPAGWQAHVDPQTGKPYYVGPNGEVSWENPGGGRAGQPGAGQGGKLPAGWQMYNDPATGKPYYVGPNGEVTFDNPGGSGASDGSYGPGGSAGAAGANGLNGPDGSGAFSMADESKHEEARAAALMAKANKKIEEAEKAEAQAKRMDWLIKALEHAVKERKRLEELVGEARKTSLSIEKDVESWMTKLSEMPVIADAEDTDTLAPGPGNDVSKTNLGATVNGMYAPSSRPGGDDAIQCETRVDPESGKTYFINPTTGETSWIKPPGAAMGVDEIQWKARVDPESGKTYYANPTTGETSWTNPSGVTGGASAPASAQGNDSISSASFHGMTGAKGKGDNFVRKNLFDFLDSKHNGVISREEFMNYFGPEYPPFQGAGIRQYPRYLCDGTFNSDGCPPEKRHVNFGWL